MVESGKCLSEKEMEILKIITEVYTQQKEMYDNHKQDNRYYDMQRYNYFYNR